MPFLRGAVTCGVELGAMEPAGHGARGCTARVQLGLFLLGGGSSLKKPCQPHQSGQGSESRGQSPQATPFCSPSPPWPWLLVLGWLSQSGVWGGGSGPTLALPLPAERLDASGPSPLQCLIVSGARRLVACRSQDPGHRIRWYASPQTPTSFPLIPGAAQVRGHVLRVFCCVWLPVLRHSGPGQRPGGGFPSMPVALVAGTWGGNLAGGDLGRHWKLLLSRPRRFPRCGASGRLCGSWEQRREGEQSQRWGPRGSS